MTAYDDDGDQDAACKHCCSPGTVLTAKGVCADTAACESVQPTLDAVLAVL